jgi:hypothetical protein
MEVTGVIAGGVELGGGAQRVGVGPAQARGVRRGRVVGVWRSPVCLPTTRSWASQHRATGGGGTLCGDIEGWAFFAAQKDP